CLPAGRKTCPGVPPARPRRSQACNLCWCSSRSYLVPSLVVVNDLCVESLSLGFVRRWTAACGMTGFRRVSCMVLIRPASALPRLFPAHHVAQGKEAGGIGVALGVLVGQARLWIVQRTALLFAGVNPD